QAIAERNDWSPNDFGLVFVLPCGTQTATKKWLESCGSLRGVAFVRGGGAFLTPDGAALVEEVLRRLGYYDELNEDLGEAIDVFAEMKGNFRALQSLGISLKPSFSVPRKAALLHCALVAPRGHGEWQRAPGD
ncbi:unnamed protein product, partial [Effrenium voratum]